MDKLFDDYACINMNIKDFKIISTFARDFLKTLLIPIVCYLQSNKLTFSQQS